MMVAWLGINIIFMPLLDLVMAPNLEEAQAVPIGLSLPENLVDYKQHIDCMNDVESLSQ